MSIGHPRALLYSLGAGIVIAFLAGLLFSVLGDRDLIYATGAMMFVTGLIALTLGVMGALEPPEGWALGRGRNRRQEGRRSMAAKTAQQHPEIESTSSAALAVWGVVVGGGLIGLSMVAFALA